MVRCNQGSRSAHGRALVWLMLLAFLAIGVGSALVLTRLKLKVAYGAKIAPQPVLQSQRLGFRGPVKEVITRLDPQTARQQTLLGPLEITRFDSSGRRIYSRVGDGHQGRCYDETTWQYDNSGKLVSEVLVSVPEDHASILRGQFTRPWPVDIRLTSDDKSLERTCDERGRLISIRSYNAPRDTSWPTSELHFEYNDYDDLTQVKSIDRTIFTEGSLVITCRLTYSYDSHGNWTHRKTVIDRASVRNVGKNVPKSVRYTFSVDRSITYYPAKATAKANTPAYGLRYDSPMALYCRTTDGSRITQALHGPVRSITGAGSRCRLVADARHDTLGRIQFNRAGKVVSRELWTPAAIKPEQLISKITNTFDADGNIRSSLTTFGFQLSSQPSYDDSLNPGFVLGETLIRGRDAYPQPYHSEKSRHKSRYDAGGRLISETKYNESGGVTAASECKYAGNIREVITKDGSGKVLAHYRATDTLDKYGNLISTQVTWLTENGKPSNRIQNLSWKMEYWQ